MTVDNNAVQICTSPSSKYKEESIQEEGDIVKKENIPSRTF